MRVWSVILAAIVMNAAPVFADQRPELSATAIALAIQESGTATLRAPIFDAGSLTLKPESTKTLQAIGEVLQSDADLKLEIRAHTSAVGAARARAAAIKAYLVDHLGIAPDRLTTIGIADTKPVAGNATGGSPTQGERIELVKK